MRRIPRGIVDEQVARTKFTLRRHTPSAELREIVEYYWLLHWDLTEPYEQQVLPNLSVHVTFFPGATGVYGPAREVFTHRLEGRVRGIAARFRPGCFRSFLDAPVRTLAGRVVEVTKIFGTAAAEVQNARTDEDLITALDNLLRAHRRPFPAAARAAADAVETIAADPGITRVAQLSAATGTSIRALQRLFAEHVGSTPKWAIRIYRLDEAARRLAAEPAPDYAGLAARLGYSDQAHFIRDFRAVTGCSPAAFTRSAHRPVPDMRNGRRE
ncbi:helix-turn-helix domain-containing protein [Amycolatopsis ultiminotia]